MPTYIHIDRHVTKKIYCAETFKAHSDMWQPCHPFEMRSVWDCLGVKNTTFPLVLTPKKGRLTASQLHALNTVVVLPHTLEEVTFSGGYCPPNETCGFILVRRV